MRNFCLLFLGFGMMVGLTVGAAAQVNPPVAPNIPAPNTQPTNPFGGNSEIFIGLSWEWAKATSANGGGLEDVAAVPISTSNSPGLQLGYRYHINEWEAVEARYGGSEPTQTYSPDVAPTTVKSLASQITFDDVWTYPSEGTLRPYLLGGFGVIHYLPIDNDQGASGQSRFTFVYGGGIDVKVRSSTKWTVRLDYQGFFYRVPDFSLISISKWNHMPQPDIALVYHF